MWTREELSKMQEATVKRLRLLFGRKDSKLVCDNCPVASECVFVYDIHTVDGNCIEDKEE